MKTTNYKLTNQIAEAHELSTIHPRKSQTHQAQQILFCSSICHSVIDFSISTGCCMPCDTFMQKKHLRVFFSIILHSVFCFLFCCSVVCCLLLCGSVLCSTFWPCSAGCGRARSGLLGILVYVQQAYSLSRNKGMKHTSKVST